MLYEKRDTQQFIQPEFMENSLLSRL